MTAADDDPNLHRTMAIAANNATWEFLDWRELAPDDVDEMLRRAYAAAYHWQRAEGAAPINQARALWLLSRCELVAGNSDRALAYAQRCQARTAEADEAADFDHGYAAEAMARSLAAVGDMAPAAEWRARAHAVEIADADDRALFEGDLNAGDWFGLG